MLNQRSRETTLDLADEELEALLAGASAMAAREIRAARTGPIFAEPPSAERLERLWDSRAELPLEGEPLDDLLESCGAVLAAGRRTAPAFFGYVLSPPSPIGVAADLLASAADQNVTSWRSAPAATHVERITLEWLGELVGFAPDAAGILVSGGSMRSPRQPRPSASSRAPLRSTRIGGSRSMRCARRSTPTAAPAGSRSASSATPGRRPPARLTALTPWPPSPRRRACGCTSMAHTARSRPPTPRTGIERADSLSIDAHKWLYVPVDCGALLLRAADAGRKAFGSQDAGFVRILADGASESYAFWDHGLELSRRFRALKLWMTLRYYGARRIAAAIAEDIAMAGYMADVVRETDDLELVAPASLSICCFRHAPPSMAPAALNEHNERLLKALQRDGRAYLSNATIGGRFALRACITNFRTTRDDVDRTLTLVRELGSRA
jgi:aromatic-L-amino-acid/L-tryptophan decarboxylase